MATPSGQIAFSQVNAELGVSPTSTQANLGSAAFRGLAGVPSGQISMSNLQNKSVFGEGVVYAFSGDNTTTDATGNGNSIINYYQFSTTQKKWGEYTHSFQTSGDTWANRLEFPTFTPSSSGWSFEFWVYPTSWAGKYLLHFGDGSLSINVQTGEFRFYNSFFAGVQNWATTTSSLLNQWNFFQIYYDTTNTKFRVNGTERASISGNTGTPSQVVLANKVSSETFGTSGYWNDILFYNGVNRGAVSVPTTPFGL